MMNLLEYAEDTGLDIQVVKKMCDKIGITYEDENSQLTEDDIILLDNEIQDQEDYVSDSEEESYEEEIEDKAEKLASLTSFDLDNQENFQKLKKSSVKKQEAKTNFIKERKKIYKHREKLQSNEIKKDENVILYKEGMTISELANLLSVSSTELIKKVMSLGVMASQNQSIDFETCEVLVADYNKELKREIMIDNYRNPFHKEVPEENQEYQKVNTNNESCIDNLDIYVKIKNNKIEDAYFEGEACAISTSATSIMLKNIVGKTKEEVIQIINNYQKMINEETYDETILKELTVYDEIYLQPNRKTCALLPVKAIEKMIK